MEFVGFKSKAALWLGVFLSVLVIFCQGQMVLEDAASSLEEHYPHREYVARELAEVLEGLLENNQDNAIAVEKKASQIPRCDVGERCAMKHGPRIGKLCDCLRGAACNTFLLRCY
ncbi:cocaine- and amphetamine-regulated transcript 4 [Polypterus senegalus]|uniref:cocaine- and amphetamine-regulated transcript 4 n=1 Tax=Polypterus senegalus TaxID=55291 RepID=UPI001966B2D4|nr:cocaine- and amphetamine-regulated transcript 4 [Polypterus senegalus]